MVFSIEHEPMNLFQLSVNRLTPSQVCDDDGIRATARKVELIPFVGQPAIDRSMPIRLTQVACLGYDLTYVRIPSESYGISASIP